MTVPDAERWDRQIHYHQCLLDVVPADADVVLDVGCGEGMLTRRLAGQARTVVGMDVDRPTLDLARSATPQANVEYLLGDVLHPPFVDGTFDAVSCVMALHHVDATAGLQRMAGLLRPGGVLAVIGVARSTAADLPWTAAGLVASTVHRRSTREWPQPAPMCWPPPVSYREMRRLAATALPGSRYQRRLLFRYTLTWTRPRSSG